MRTAAKLNDLKITDNRQIILGPKFTSCTTGKDKLLLKHTLHTHFLGKWDRVRADRQHFEHLLRAANFSFRLILLFNLANMHFVIGTL